MRPDEVPTSLFLQQFVKEARGYTGVSRSGDRQQVTKFLNLFGLDFADEAGHPYPFCAAGACYAAARALADLTQTVYSADNSVEVFGRMLSTINNRWFKPSAACHEIAEDAARRSTWIPRDHVLAALQNHTYSFQPGSLIFYNWQLPSDASLAKPSNVHHVEIILQITANEVDTIGFNTSSTSAGNQGNSGAVAYKRRDLRCMVGIVDPTRK